MFKRTLVPLVVCSELTYLNASFQPPSNGIIHAAINEFNPQALLSPHPKPGWQQNAEKVRQLIARYINADSTSITLMRDTTEGLNNFIRSISFKPGDNVVILDSEDPNHAYGWMALRAMGLEVRQVPTIPESLETGKVVAANAEAFAPFVNDRTRAIGLSSIMFHSGQKNDVKEICNVYRPRGIHVLVDMTQQVGFAPVDVTDLNVSAAAFGFHKDTSPPVVGYGAVSNVRGDLLVPSDPIIYHPNARRFEHLNVSLVSCAAARRRFEFYPDVMGPENVQEHLKSLVDALRNACKALGIKIVGPEDREHHAPHLYILDLHGAKWMEHLTAHKVYVTLYRLGNWALTTVLQSGIDAGIPLK
ncbi:pyridoxal phosphate-dependent transferase [Aspergillus pseudocaelatus]|uniref:Pyridoxal phosphate-dependent transferase n=1 Tax=Aspergillus pseudocaelatus TaxID=1825620 RepID=A0ABQ6X3Q9_9EURO|nr:pyridoxal phosphate-dependent transferase [Aspergillus pseudocaelatus]